jgi:hypothetical protein
VGFAQDISLLKFCIHSFTSSFQPQIHEYCKLQVSTALTQLNDSYKSLSLELYSNNPIPQLISSNYIINFQEHTVSEYLLLFENVTHILILKIFSSCLAENTLPFHDEGTIICDVKVVNRPLF